MGFNTWNRFHCDINETIIRNTAKALVDTGTLSPVATLLPFHELRLCCCHLQARSLCLARFPERHALSRGGSIG